MAQFGKWQTMEELGRGRQGTVFLAVDVTKYDSEKIALAIRDAVNRLIAITVLPSPPGAPDAHELARLVLKYGQANDPAHCGALKRGSADLICRSAVGSRIPTKEPQT